ncbi:PREDICTED: solute carrier family 22 member 10 [Odobenus rosmarus divergens]|uniref:Solute carrier family 22 member 10 n=1 Tax=Odobenus rosmarus divergens TaxID=9708 RepID=A0A2U3WWG1_ODORO|nr:PREDICTED: solute carrier family 22 member 10 [Odobenus rosmarus divergens]
MAAPKQPQQSISHPNGCIPRSGAGGVPGPPGIIPGAFRVVLQGASFTQRVREVVPLIGNVPVNTDEEGLRAVKTVSQVNVAGFARQVKIGSSFSHGRHLVGLPHAMIIPPGLFFVLRFGRKLILRWCLLQLTIFGTSSAFAPTFLIYCSLRFLSGCSSIVILTNGAMLIIEWIRPPSKVMAITLITCALSMGQILLGGLAFAFREWCTLQLVVSVPFLVFFLSSRQIVESARWLIVNNKPEEGLKALRKVAHTNGIQNAGDALTLESLRSSMQDELEAAQTKATEFDLFRTPSLRKRTCLLLFVRFAITIPFYGIMINLQYFGSNIFLFQVVFGALTAIVRCLPLLVQNHMGRRTTQTLFMFLVGLSVLVNTFVPQEMQTLRVSLASVGISFSAASVTSFSVHLIELNPTVLRARALGLDTVASRCGATLAPLLMTLIAYLSTLPWIIYGVFPIIAGLVVLFLPETRNLPLLDTIHDVKNNKEFSRKVNEVNEINSSVKVTKV